MEDKLIRLCIAEGRSFEANLNRIDRCGCRDDYEERAGILEFDGGFTREQAEHQAAREIIERYGL